MAGPRGSLPACLLGPPRPVTDLPNGVEQGLAWPSKLTTVRAAYMSKAGPAPDPGSDALAFRVLSIMAVVYRRWASLRAKQLRKWTESWSHSALFAGVPHRSAQDAWWTNSIMPERAFIEGDLVVNGSS